MTDADTDGSRTVKCSIGRLLCSRPLRLQIESVVERLQVLSVRGSLVAAEVVWRERAAGRCPRVDDQTWWYRCFTSGGSLRGHLTTIKQDACIGEAASDLFKDYASVSTDYLWPFLAELSRDFLTMTRNMMASNLHSEIRKAVRREVYLASGKLDARTVGTIATHYERRAVGHCYIPEIYGSLDSSLKERLDVMVEEWRRDFATALPCPTAEFIYNDKKKTMPVFEWLERLRQHREDCLNRMADHFTDDSDPMARSRKEFGKLARAVAPLPFASFGVGHVAISNTGLKSLLSGCGIRDSESKFETYFPGIKKLLGKRSEFQNYLRTDGVSASLVVKKQSSDALPEAKTRKRRNRGDTLPMFVLPETDQRIVGIDPGRRDMVAVCAPGEKPFKLSTRAFLHESGYRSSMQKTSKVLEKKTADGTTTIAELVQALPSRREAGSWPSFKTALLPHLEEILKAYSAKCLRRQKLTSYMKRDRALDSLCKRITNGKTKTLVAFGAANSCSTGFGHAPAPQARLRHRLARVHGALVFMVDEYLTSQKCSTCSNQLCPAFGSTRSEDGHKVRKEIHGVRYCSSCHNLSGSPLFWHRDFNAAANILACYLSVASTGARPTAFQRPVVPGSSYEEPASKRAKRTAKTTL